MCHIPSVVLVLSNLLLHILHILNSVLGEHVTIVASCKEHNVQCPEGVQVHLGIGCLEGQVGWRSEWVGGVGTLHPEITLIAFCSDESTLIHPISHGMFGSQVTL